MMQNKVPFLVAVPARVRRGLGLCRCDERAHGLSEPDGTAASVRGIRERNEEIQTKAHVRKAGLLR